MYIVLLGGPGAGKGTLAKQLHEGYGFFLLSPGELYRKEADLGTEFGLKAKNEYWGAGNLCPNEMTNELVLRTLNSVALKMNNIIFDGYPRTYEQAIYLNSITNIDLVLDISAGEDVVVRRLLRRATIENRSDDTEEIIKNRLTVYNSNNAKILEYYKKNNRYQLIDGAGSPQDTLDLVEVCLPRLRRVK